MRQFSPKKGEFFYSSNEGTAGLKYVVVQDGDEWYCLYENGFKMNKTSHNWPSSMWYELKPEEFVFLDVIHKNTPSSSKKCECDSKTLLWQGCQCGGC